MIFYDYFQLVKELITLQKLDFRKLVLIADTVKLIKKKKEYETREEVLEILGTMVLQFEKN